MVKYIVTIQTAFCFSRDIQNEGWVDIEMIDENTIEVWFWYLDVPIYPPQQSVLIRRKPDSDTLLVVQSMTGLWLPEVML